MLTRGVRTCGRSPRANHLTMGAACTIAPTLERSASETDLAAVRFGANEAVSCLQASSAVLSSEGGIEFWMAVQATGAPPLARAEFSTTASSGGMCVDCSGEGQPVFGQGGSPLRYTLSYSASGTKLSLPVSGSTIKTAAVATDASSQYPNFAIVRWRVDFAGTVSTWANGVLLGSTDLGSIPGLSEGELDVTQNFTLVNPVSAPVPSGLRHCPSCRCKSMWA